MRQVVLAGAFALPLLLIATTAFGQSSDAGLTDNSIKYISYLFAMAIAAFGGASAQSVAAAAALEGISRNPAAADKVQNAMILSLALMESLVIFVLISIFILG
jgi:F-type H+-transporting ATPase subunit c